MHSPLISLCKDIPFINLGVQLKLDDNLVGYLYSGSLLHGALTNALYSVNPKLCQFLLGEQDASSPRGYFFSAPFLPKNGLNKGKLFNFSIKLFGKACEYLAEIVHSLFILQTKGLGSKSVNFKVHKINLRHQGRDLMLYKSGCKLDLLVPPATNLADQLFIPFEADSPLWLAQLNIHSPIFLKMKGKLSKHAPPLDNWTLSVANRLQLLCDNHFTTDYDCKELLCSTKHNKAIYDASKFFIQTRQTNIADQAHDLSGLVGQIQYQATSQSLLWLQIGSALQIGKKANFGQGNYSLEYALMSDHDDSVQPVM